MIIRSVALACALIASQSVHAGCGQVSTQCVHYVGKKLFKASACEIEECGNARGALQKWKWQGYNINLDFDAKGKVQINGKLGYIAERSGMTCFGERDAGPDIFCRKD